MRIYNNIPALQTRLAILNAGRRTDTNMQRLSTGVRINSAKDDAAGMAITNKLKLQIKGLQKASQNSMDGISMVQTADGALVEVHNALQRMRELAVQAANDTLTAEDKLKAQQEINQLLQEIDSISYKTEFNGFKILSGAASRMALTTNATGGVAFKTPDTAAKISYLSSTIQPGILDYKITQAGLPTQMSFNVNLGTPGVLDFGNNVFVPVLETDTLDNIVKKIHEVSDELDIDVWKGTAPADDIFIQARSAGSDRTLSLDVTKPFTLNFDFNPGATGKITVIDELSNFHEIDIAATDTAQTVLNKIKERLPNMNVKVDDTVNPNLFTINSVTGWQFTVAGTGSVSNVAQNVSLPVAMNAPIPPATVADPKFGTIKPGQDAKATVRMLYPDGTPNTVFNSSSTVTSQGNRITINSINDQKIYIDLVIETDEDGNHWFVSKDGAGNPISADTVPNNLLFNGNIQDYGPLVIQSGANKGLETVIQIPPMSVSIMGLEGLTIMNEEFANKALNMLDAALAYVSDSRGALGAYQNRLEFTVRNLDISAENLESSRSRLEDTDMALEMAELSRNQVVSQAAMSILAQANQRPQQILTLLK